MGSAALGLRARVIDMGNGVYRIDDVQRCAPMGGGELIEAGDFVEDVVACALERLGMVGPAVRWVASVVADGDDVVIEAWLPPLARHGELTNSHLQSHCGCH